jgi:hypothetical protein
MDLLVKKIDPFFTEFTCLGKSGSLFILEVPDLTFYKLFEKQCNSILVENNIL